MTLGMFLSPISRSVKDRGGWHVTAKGPVIADIGPDVARDGFALRQDRYRGVVSMQALSRQNVGLDQRVQGLESQSAGTDLVGQRRDAEIDAFPAISLALPVQRLMLAELLEQHHRKQVRPGKAARRHMEGRRRLRDLLAVAAGELLPYRLHDLPLPRDHFQRFGNVFAELR